MSEEDEKLAEWRDGMRRSVEKRRVHESLIAGITATVEAHMEKYGLLPPEEMDANAARH